MVIVNIILDYLKTSVHNLLTITNPFSANFTKWSNTLKQFVRNLPTNCLSVFDQFVGLALKGLTVQGRILWKKFSETLNKII